MAVNYFSDLYAGLATPSTLDTQKRASVGVSHGRIRYCRAQFDPGAVVSINSNIRLKQFKSGDRIHSILLSATDSGSAGTLNFGIYKTGASHDGVVVDANLFASVVDMTGSGPMAQTEIFDEAALDDFDRGKTLWELNGDSVDPMEDWDFSADMAAAATLDTFQFTVEIFYTSGD